ncbi:chondroitin sulfate proteoglycan 5 [Pelobates cultripes]|uniref:Chondroitin sulfate proteoglycan 5 n=1 Tax=Pelobates cultripes TaxID=61616 RepID=A0AAD1SKK7_PELCU|nr:chondroitin sulfate proteoglycan 5 [Pelobates cultripes]
MQQRLRTKHITDHTFPLNTVGLRFPGSIKTRTGGMEILEERDFFKEILKFHKKNRDRSTGLKALQIQTSSSRWKRKHIRDCPIRGLLYARNRQRLHEPEGKSPTKEVILNKGGSRKCVSSMDTFRDRLPKSKRGKVVSKGFKRKKFVSIVNKPKQGTMGGKQHRSWSGRKGAVVPKDLKSLSKGSISSELGLHPRGDKGLTSKEVLVRNVGSRQPNIFLIPRSKNKMGLYPEVHREMLFKEISPTNYTSSDVFSSTSKNTWLDEEGVDRMMNTSGQHSSFSDPQFQTDGSGSSPVISDYNQEWDNSNNIQKVFQSITSSTDLLQIPTNNPEGIISMFAQPFLTTTFQQLLRETLPFSTLKREEVTTRVANSTPREGLLGLVKLYSVDRSAKVSESLGCKSGYVEFGGTCSSICDLDPIYCENRGQCVIVENIGAMCSRFWISTLFPESSDSSSSISDASDFTWSSHCDSLPDLSTFGNTKTATCDSGLWTSESTRL